MPPENAVELLQAWGGDHAADHDAASRICQLAGCLPLAIQLAGSYLFENQENAADYLAWLEKSGLAALDLGQRQSQSIPLLLERSLAQLSPTACQALAVVGLLDIAPFSSHIIAAALDLPEDETRRALGQLIRYSLLIHPDQRYQVSHALIHTYARQRLSPPTSALTRLAAHYIAFTEALMSSIV